MYSDPVFRIWLLNFKNVFKTAKFYFEILHMGLQASRILR
jgi:hypothetical protein